MAAISITTSALSDATLTPEARAVLDHLHAAPLSARGDRALRIISSTYYADGCCYARQATLARAVGCAKSTLQKELDELEARRLTYVTPRDGTSNVTVLAEGVREALRFQRIENRRRALARRGVAPLPPKSPTAPSPMPPKTSRATVAAPPASVDPSGVVRGHFEPEKRARKQADNKGSVVVRSTIRPKSTTCSEYSTSRTYST